MSASKLTRSALAVLACAALTMMPMPSARAQTQAEMNQAAGRDAGRADAAMNAACQKLMAVLTPAQKTQLVKAQAGMACLPRRRIRPALLAVHRRQHAPDGLRGCHAKPHGSTHQRAERLPKRDERRKQRALDAHSRSSGSISVSVSKSAGDTPIRKSWIATGASFRSK